MTSKFFRTSILLAATVILATACGSSQPGNKDAYQANTDSCSSQIINDYNDIVNSFKTMSTMGDLDSAESLVNRFSAKYAGVSCKAQNLSTSAETTIDVNAEVARWKSGIKGVRTKVAEAGSSSRPANPPTVPTPPMKTIDRNVSVDTLSSFTLTVTDAYALTRLSDGNGEVFLQGGLVKTAGEIAPGIYCFIKKLGATSPIFTNGGSSQLTIKKIEGVNLAAFPADTSFALACVKYPDSTASLTIAELDAAFASVAKITFSQ